MNLEKYHFKDRQLSKSEKAVIIGLYRQGASLIETMGIMELHQDTIEEVLQNYFGTKLSSQKRNEP